MHKHIRVQVQLLGGRCSRVFEMSHCRWLECCWCCGDVVAYQIGIEIELMEMGMEFGIENDRDRIRIR